MANNKKERQYSMSYWMKGGKLCHETFGFKNKNEAYKWIYDLEFLPLNVKFIGWR